MIYLTAAQVLFIHNRLMAETGGAAGIRDLRLLAAAVARPQATYDGLDLYPEVILKAAVFREMSTWFTQHSEWIEPAP